MVQKRVAEEGLGEGEACQILLTASTGMKCHSKQNQHEVKILQYCHINFFLHVASEKFNVKKVN